MAILQTEDLTYTYSIGTPFEKTAVDHVSLSIDEGEFVGVIGHTGSGKSTLIQQFNGLLRPTAGRILVDGRDIWKGTKAELRALRFQVGLVFQYPEYQLFEDTVYQDIAFGPKNMGLDEKEVDRRVRETARAVGVHDSWLEKPPFALSGGQKRRVAIAGVMAMEPRILIFDEPTAGLDPMGRDKILSRIKAYHKQHGGTVLLVSHSMEDVARYATRLLVLHHGRVFCYDTPERVFARAEELSELGLSVPQITRVCDLLREQGVDLGESVYTVPYAKELLLRRLAERKGEGSC